jgi:hypothetical protein
MSRRSQLENYPQLRDALKASTKVNTQFNTFVSTLRQPASTSTIVERLDNELATTRMQLQDIAGSLEEATAVRKKLEEFVISLGEVLETQVSLAPYSQDVAKKRKYSIVFTPTQVRTAMRLYWEVVALVMEDRLLRVAKVEDPAADRSV